MSTRADLAVLCRRPGYRRLLAVRLLSQGVDGAFQVALAGLVFFSAERQATAGAAALVFAVTTLPFTVLGPVAGVFLDRWPRRAVLVWANLGRAALVTGTAAFVHARGVDWALYLAVLLALSANRFFLAALSAGLPRVVPAHELLLAGALTPTLGTVAAFLGAGLGYGMRLAGGARDATDAVILLTAAAGYAASALTARGFARRALGPPAGTVRRVRPAGSAWAHHVAGFVRQAAEILTALRRTSLAGGMLALTGVHRFVFGMVTVSAILLCRNTFAATPEEGLTLLGGILGAAGIGVFLAAGLVTQLSRALGPRTVVALAFLIMASTLAVCATAMPYGVAVTASFVLGLAGQTAKICTDVAVQSELPDRLRGRAFTLYDAVFNGAFLLAAALSVLVVPGAGYSRVLYAALAVLYLVGAGAFWHRTARH